MNIINSPTRELLALPDIGSAGVQHSIVFEALPLGVQAAIHEAATEEHKTAIAAAAGDKLPMIAEMYEHFISAPARRKTEGQAFPSLESLDSFPLPGVLKESDRAWLRPGQRIARIEGQGELGREDGHWTLTILYADGVRCTTDPVATLDEFFALREHVEQASGILGLVDKSEV
ncbi:hypothetical protein [Hydrogenophaga sp. NFH-34]|uniref:hypothetical protein n=1 Tax=Hydrogenophaga sp. NFH-34 TaxID=2744446 RepID=UPI001F157DDE|nr:hypothetical protein [Hydrogenophaga sp. NFH-34]